MGIKNLKSFNQQLNQFSKSLIPADAVLFQKKIALDLLVKIVLRTPVDTGRARGGWQVTIGQPATDSPLALDKDGGATIAKGKKVIESVGFGQVIYISNNVTYIRALEEGWSKRSADGMVQVSLNEMEGIFG